MCRYEKSPNTIELQESTGWHQAKSVQREERVKENTAGASSVHQKELKIDEKGSNLGDVQILGGLSHQECSGTVQD